MAYIPVLVVVAGPIAGPGLLLLAETGQRVETMSGPVRLFPFSATRVFPPAFRPSASHSERARDALSQPERGAALRST
eukprot:13748400-Alexandrium_andersonii.AAC.1